MLRYLLVGIGIFFCSYLSGQQDTISENIPAQETKNLYTQEIVIKVAELDAMGRETLDSFLLELDTIVNGLTREPMIYGHHMFSSDSIQGFTANGVVKVPDTYIVGSDDEIGITIFGASQFDAKLVVDPEGFIRPGQEWPRILVKGLTWSQAKESIYQRMRRYATFSIGQIAITLTSPRVVTVNVFGEVKNPGSYTMSAANTVFNAIAAAGGPTWEASVRKIQVVDGSSSSTFDLYQILENPISQFDYFVDDNMYINVPSADEIVEMQGAINRPMRYEIIKGEGLQDVISYAGGLGANAIVELIQVKRYADDEQRLIDVNLKELQGTNNDFVLQHGDEVLFRAIDNQVVNSVSIQGPVFLEGDFSLESTPTVYNLVEKARLKKEARRDIAFLQRLNADSTYQILQINLNNVLDKGDDNLALQASDKLIVTEQSNYALRSTVSVTGAVQNEVELPFDPSRSLTVQKALLIAGGLNIDAADKGYIVRTNVSNPNEKEYVTVNLRQALNDATSEDNVTLEPLDEIKAIKAQSYSDTLKVVVSGAVRQKGEFIYDESLRLQDALLLSGGLSSDASGSIDIFRLGVDSQNKSSREVITIEVDENLNIVGGKTDFQLQPRDEIVPRFVEEFELQSIVIIEGEVVSPGEYGLLKQNETLASLIQRSGGYTAEAFEDGVTIQRFERFDSLLNEEVRFQVVVAQSAKKGSTVLKDRDIIIIPKKQDVVYIETANTRSKELYPERFKDIDKLAVPYTAGKSAKWYVDNYAGGYGQHADKCLTVVAQANGAMSKVKGIWPFRKWPKPGVGAMIKVGKKEEKQKGEADSAGRASPLPRNQSSSDNLAG